MKAKDGSHQLPNSSNIASNWDASDLVALLRNTQAQVPFGAALRAVGATLLSTGLAWGIVRFVKANPYVLLVLLGLVCLIASLATDRDGLLSYLPEDVQETLLKKTLFDFLHDDFSQINFFRKWGRAQLLALQDGQSEGSVQKITEDMDPAFLNMLLRRTWIQCLPPLVIRLMLPEAVFSADTVGSSSSSCLSDPKAAVSRGRLSRCQVPIATEVPAMATGSSCSSSSGLVSRRGKLSPDELSPTSLSHNDALAAAAEIVSSRTKSADQPAPSMPWVLQFLKEKHEANQSKITEKELGPVILSCTGIEPKLRVLGRHTLSCLKALAAAAASGWVAFAGLLYFGSGPTLLVRGFTLTGMAHRIPGDEQLTKASRWAAAISLISAGGTIALAAYASRYSKFFEDNPASMRDSLFSGLFSKAKSSDARSIFSEPEREESPADSEVSCPEDDL
eukprot:TRINITY_DN34648_c0_g1_i1.p1 TRINITY_DN34648_c0_g1~~TRINITY_DN34648_c0_g1_i1.p1  ORF type:complete len:449 (-),score=80.04 TRINITY_DN34648_c0_g1_i1:82-1428(-)